MCTRFSLSMEMSRLTRDGNAEPVSRDQILRRERGQENINFPCSADHVQDWQPFAVDPHTLYIICATIHTQYIDADPDQQYINQDAGRGTQDAGELQRGRR